MLPASVARIFTTAVIALALLLVGCGGDDDAEPVAAEPVTEEPVGEEAPEPEPPPEPEEPSGVEITTSDSQFGQVLFDGDEQAIYYFEPEGTSDPECYGSCAEAWPPVLTEGEPQGSGNVRQRLLGTTERRGGGIQVTYGGRPLYHYADEGPGELRCHNIDHEGGLWLAVQPNGEPVPHDPAETVFLD